MHFLEYGTPLAYVETGMVDISNWRGVIVILIVSLKSPITDAEPLLPSIAGDRLFSLINAYL